MQDCSADKLEYWGGEYLDLVWNMTGTAECCYEDDCNDNRDTTTTETLTTTMETVETTTSLSVEQTTTTSIINEELSIDCRNCEVKWSVCDYLKSHTEVSQDLVKLIRSDSSQSCSCLPGFLPLFSEKGLVKCVDPIVQTSSLFSRFNQMFFQYLSNNTDFFINI